jgi:hypothetical protein
MSDDSMHFGRFVVPDDAPRIGETEGHGDKARIISKISNPHDRHQKWYVIEVDPNGEAFGWHQELRDHGMYGKFSLLTLSNAGMVQEKIGTETVQTMREYGYME